MCTVTNLFESLKVSDVYTTSIKISLSLPHVNRKWILVGRKISDSKQNAQLITLKKDFS